MFSRRLAEFKYGGIPKEVRAFFLLSCLFHVIARLTLSTLCPRPLRPSSARRTCPTAFTSTSRRTSSRASTGRRSSRCARSPLALMPVGRATLTRETGPCHRRAPGSAPRASSAPSTTCTPPRCQRSIHSVHPRTPRIPKRGRRGPPPHPPILELVPSSCLPLSSCLSELRAPTRAPGTWYPRRASCCFTQRRAGGWRARKTSLERARTRTFRSSCP